METIQKLDAASALDHKMEELAYIAVLADVRLESGLPAIGNAVIQSLPIALEAFDSE